VHELEGHAGVELERRRAMSLEPDSEKAKVVDPGALSSQRDSSLTVRGGNGRYPTVAVYERPKRAGNRA